MNFSQLMGLAGGHVEARIVQTAVELVIFDALEATDLDAPTLAQTLNLHEPATELLLNALTAVGLLEKHRRSFSLTEVSRRHLLRSSPHYVGAMIGFDAMLWRDWEKLPEAIRTGLPTRPP
ncbi:MAG: methyltransferase family protein, partial [Candidatus Binatia bacterium]